MAREETSRSFNTRTAGGSPYLQSFLQPADSVQTAQFERELQMNRAEREDKSFALAEERARRQEEFQNRELEYRQKAEDRRLEAANLAIRKQDAKDALDLQEKKRETEASEVAGRIGLLDESSPAVREELQKIVSENPSVFTSKYAKFPLEQLQTKKEGHEAYIGWLSKAAQESGYAGDVYSLPKNDMGAFDTTQNGQIFGPNGVFTVSFAQKQEKEKLDEERLLQEANRRSFAGESTSVKLRNGETITIPAKKQVQPEEIKKDFSLTYGAPVEALSQQYGATPKKGTITIARGNFEDNKFVPSESGNVVEVIDATKGMDKAIRHRIPFDKFESYRSQIGNGAPSQVITAPNGIEISSPLGMQNPSLQPSTPLPQRKTEGKNERPPLSNFQIN